MNHATKQQSAVRGSRLISVVQIACVVLCLGCQTLIFAFALCNQDSEMSHVELPTAAIKRVFSVAGFLISSRRTLRSDETFEFPLFNHLNCDLRTFGARVVDMINGRKRKHKDCA